MECRAVWNPNRDIAHRNAVDVGLRIDFHYGSAPCRAFYTGTQNIRESVLVTLDDSRVMSRILLRCTTDSWHGLFTSQQVV